MSEFDSYPQEPNQDEHFHFMSPSHVTDDENSSTLNDINNNNLLLSLGPAFILRGEVYSSDVESVVKIIRKAVEEGIETDEAITAAMKCNSYTLLRFLLAVVNCGVSTDSQDSATRSLVMMGNIVPDVWLQFTSADDSNVQVLLAASRSSLDRLQRLSSDTPTAQTWHPDAYVGYDARDKAEYNIQGYEYTDEMTSHNEGLAAAAAQRREGLLMWLLFVSQLYHQPLPQLTSRIEQERRGGGKEAAAEAGVIGELESLCHSLLVLSRDLAEEAYLFGIKIVAEVNNQFPLPEDTSCEIATVFSKLDAEASHNVHITQGLMHVLNENGYPNVQPNETAAVIRLCTDLLFVYSNVKAVGGDLEQVHPGHYYTNDIKVLLEIVLREMRNIPFNGHVSATYSAEEKELHGHVRGMLMELIDAIIQESSWAGAGEFYLRDEMKRLIDEVYQAEEDFARRDFAYALLYKYRHHFVVMPGDS